MIALDTNTYQQICLCMMRLEEVAVLFQKKLVGSSFKLLVKLPVSASGAPVDFMDPMDPNIISSYRR